MLTSFKEYLESTTDNHPELKVKKQDIIKLSNRSRYSPNIADKALENIVIPYPNFDSFNLMNIKDWDIKNKKYGRTYPLYIHSLRFVNELLLMYEHTKRDKYLLKARDYIEQWMSYAMQDTVSELVWYDHAVAQRSQVLLFYVYLAQEKELFDANLFYKTLNYHGEYLAKEAKYVRTNHGLMMDRSLMTLGVVLEQESLFNVGYYRSIDTFWYSFSPKGHHLENSPVYHSMVVKMYRELELFLNKYHKSYGDIIMKTLDNAEKIKGILTLPSGYYINIGDTDHEVEENKTSYENYIDYESGLSVIQKEERELYITFISGYSSTTHKHLDDLSVTFFYKGLKFLEDAGRYNYTYDPHRLYIRSEKAHSGMYIKDDEYKLTGNNRFTREVKMDHHFENEKLFQAKGSHSAYRKGELLRNIIFIKEENVFIILDEVQSKEDIEVVHNFNLNKDVEVIQEDNNEFVLKNEDVSLSLKSLSSNVTGKIINGIYNEKNIQALNSPVFNKLDKTKQIHYTEKLNKGKRSYSIFLFADVQDNHIIKLKHKEEDGLLFVTINNKIYYINV